MICLAQWCHLPRRVNSCQKVNEKSVRFDQSVKFGLPTTSKGLAMLDMWNVEICHETLPMCFFFNAPPPASQSGLNLSNLYMTMISSGLEKCWIVASEESINQSLIVHQMSENKIISSSSAGRN